MYVCTYSSIHVSKNWILCVYGVHVCTHVHTCIKVHSVPYVWYVIGKAVEDTYIQKLPFVCLQGNHMKYHICYSPTMQRHFSCYEIYSHTK